VPVQVLLAGIADVDAVVHGIGHPVAVAVGVAHVAQAVVVHVLLVAVGHGRAVVEVVGDAVVVSVADGGLAVVGAGRVRGRGLAGGGRDAVDLALDVNDGGRAEHLAVAVAAGDGQGHREGAAPGVVVRGRVARRG